MLSTAGRSPAHASFSLQRSSTLGQASYWRADEYNPQEQLARAEQRAEQACSLYVALVYRDPGMLRGLLESYALADPISRRMLEKLGDTLAVYMTSSNPELQAAVVDHPTGSEPLLLSMLMKLTGAHCNIQPALFEPPTRAILQIPTSRSFISMPKAWSWLLQHASFQVVIA